MAEYIEREAAIKLLHYNADESCSSVVADFEALPAKDVAPVVHGWWEWYEEQHGTPIDGHDYDWGWRCSHCKTDLPDNYDAPDYPPQLKYCPSCGAKMEEAR